MDDAVRQYIEGIEPAHRPLFDRIHRLVVAAHPDVALVLSYKMPAFTRGRRRLFVAAWRHGISLYGWDQARDGGFVARHPALKSGRSTVRLRPADAVDVTDQELRDLIDAALT